MQYIRTIVALMVTAVFLLTSVGPFNATVLCMGLDGHVEVEAATQGVCTSNADGDSERTITDTAVYTARHQDDHCGSCVDIPLGTGAGANSTVRPQTTRTEIKVSAPDILLQVTALAAVRVTPITHQTSNATMPNPMLLRLRTVTLLI